MQCPLEEGDRVDHRRFGLGTVIGAPMGSVGPDMDSASGLSFAGWSVPIRWDDEEQRDSSIVYRKDGEFMWKVSSPDSRPFTYWGRQWQPLLQTWLEARREVERIASTFRPLPDEELLSEAQEAEQVAYEAVKAFWQEEERGGHP